MIGIMKIIVFVDIRKICKRDLIETEETLRRCDELIVTIWAKLTKAGRVDKAWIDSSALGVLRIKKGEVSRRHKVVAQYG